MKRLKAILFILVSTLSAGGAQAALVNFTLVGDVVTADTGNGFGLNTSTNNLITMTGVFNDSALTGSGAESVVFSLGSGNSLNLVVGSKSFTAADDINFSSGSPPPTLSFLGGAFDGFNFLAEFGTFGSFSSVGTSIVAGDDNFNSNKVIGTWTGYSVSAVPVPAAVWLFGSGLLGLVGVARRKR